jgi:hypothetical protein
MEAILDPAQPAWKLTLPPLAGMAVAWFLYVPAHELLHVAGCVATGCTVSELRIAPAYGGRILQSLLPFVVASDEYAGRLSGFDTRGSDARYLATDIAPFIPAALLGVPLLRWVARGAEGRRGARRWLFGPAVVLAAGPFVSLAGDYFEMGTILTTAPLAASWHALRSDDLFRLVGELRRGEVEVSGAGAAGIIVISLLLGCVMAGWTYSLGAFVSLLRGRISSHSARG